MSVRLRTVVTDYLAKLCLTRCDFGGFNSACIERGADAHTNLPGSGKVVPARGCGHEGNERVVVNCQPSSNKPMEGFLMTKRSESKLTDAYTGPITAIIGPRDDTGRPPIKRCVLAGLDAIYGAHVSSINTAIGHKLRCGAVAKYMRERDFEATRHLPRGKVTVADRNNIKFHINFDAARKHALKYARENGIEINCDRIAGRSTQIR